MAKGLKAIWTDEMIEYIKDNFSDTSNEKLATWLGLSPRTIIRKARELGLSKTESFMHECSGKGGEAAGKFWRKGGDGYYKYRDLIRRNLHCDDGQNRHRFRKGESLKDRIGEERFKASREKARLKLIAMAKRDRTRVLAGLKPITRLPLGFCKGSKLRRAIISARFLLRARYGYIVTDARNCKSTVLDVYYDDGTRRNPKLEDKYSKKYGIRFTRMGEETQVRRVASRSEWSDTQGGLNTFSSY